MDGDGCSKRDVEQEKKDEEGECGMREILLRELSEGDVNIVKTEMKVVKMRPLQAAFHHCSSSSSYTPLSDSSAPHSLEDGGLRSTIR
ncbi:hypothetical protein PAMA_017692 [Pampus argenteus]